MLELYSINIPLCSLFINAHIISKFVVVYLNIYEGKQNMRVQNWGTDETPKVCDTCQQHLVINICLCYLGIGTF